MLQPFRLSVEEQHNLNALVESPAPGLPLDAHLCSIRSRDRLMPRIGNLDRIRIITSSDCMFTSLAFQRRLPLRRLP